MHIPTSSPAQAPHRVLDLQAWPRRSHYRFFSGFGWPFFSVTARVDVTDVVEAARARGARLFPSILHHVMAAANEVEALRLRMVGDEVWCFETISPSFTVLATEEVFNYCVVDWTPDEARFCQEVRLAAEALEGVVALNLEDDVRHDLVFVSSLPWLDFTAVDHPRPLGQGHDSVPRIAWGKIGQGADGRHTMPLNVAAHHALLDGLHLARFFERVGAQRSS